MDSPDLENQTKVWIDELNAIGIINGKNTKLYTHNGTRFQIILEMEDNKLKNFEIINIDRS